MATRKKTVLSHQQTPEYLIELWKAIHGPDPAPPELRDLVSLRLISALAGSLGNSGAKRQLQGTISPLIQAQVKTALTK
jgi:hypothetical protein